jgi:hypothetical protein
MEANLILEVSRINQNIIKGDLKLKLCFGCGGGILKFRRGCEDKSLVTPGDKILRHFMCMA